MRVDVCHVRREDATRNADAGKRSAETNPRLFAETDDARATVEKKRRLAETEISTSRHKDLQPRRRRGRDADRLVERGDAATATRDRRTDAGERRVVRAARQRQEVQRAVR